MKPHSIFLLFLLMACQKPKSEPQITSTTPNATTEKTTVLKENFLKTDTISISDDGETSRDNYILAHLINQKMDKDSIITAQFRLDFYQNKVKTADSKITIKEIDKGSEWGASYGLSSTQTPKNSPFVKISFGYPACGYTSINYLYYLNSNDLQLVHQWDVMSDSGWGTWVEFDNPAKSNPDSFYCKTVSFEPEDDNEDMGTVSHSDSIVFHLVGNRWKKQLLSEKDKIYFEKKIPFNEFHSLN